MAAAATAAATAAAVVVVVSRQKRAHAPTAENQPSQGKSATESRRGTAPPGVKYIYTYICIYTFVYLYKDIYAMSRAEAQLDPLG